MNDLATCKRSTLKGAFRAHPTKGCFSILCSTLAGSFTARRSTSHQQPPITRTSPRARMLTSMFSYPRRRLLTGAAAIAATACGSAAPLARPDALLKPPITYVAIGASDAVGVGIENPQRDGWVPVLFGRLPRPAKLVNLGIPGIKLR